MVCPTDNFNKLDPDQYLYIWMWIQPDLWVEKISSAKNKLIYYDCSTEQSIPMLRPVKHRHYDPDHTGVLPLSLPLNLGLGTGWGGIEYYGTLEDDGSYEYSIHCLQGLHNVLESNQSVLFINVCAYDSAPEIMWLRDLLAKLPDSGRIIVNCNPFCWHLLGFPSWSRHGDGLIKGRYVQIPTNFSKLFVSQNGRPHPHRCFFMDTIAEYNLVDSGYITWRGDEEWEIGSSNPVGYPFKYWTPEIIRPDGGLGNAHCIPQYSDAFMDLISESTPDSHYFTEKSARPIVNLRPFLVQSGQYSHARLRDDFGYAMYDEIFDYSFDSEPNEYTRTRGLMEQVAQYRDASKEDLYEMYQLIFPKVVNNFVTFSNLPATTLQKEHLWIRRFERPKWQFSHREQIMDKLISQLKEQYVL